VAFQCPKCEKYISDSLPPVIVLINYSTSPMMYVSNLFIRLVLPLLALTTANYTVPLLTADLSPLGPDLREILLASSAPPGAEIISLTIAGPGCLHGAAYTARRNESLAVYTPRLTATSGPDESATDGRRFCQVVLDVTVPNGWQTGLRAAESSGYVSIGENAEGQVVGMTWFSGVEKQVCTLPDTES
jgi:Domain of unknown function (DUF4360)